MYFYCLCSKTVSSDNLQGGGGARLTGHIQIEGNEDQLRATINDIEQRFNSTWLTSFVDLLAHYNFCFTLTGMRCSSSWSSRSRSCTRCSWISPFSWRTRARWSTGIWCWRKHWKVQIQNNFPQNWCPCRECGRIHDSCNQWHQESSRVPTEGPQVTARLIFEQFFQNYMLDVCSCWCRHWPRFPQIGRRSWCWSVSWSAPPSAPGWLSNISASSKEAAVRADIIFHFVIVRWDTLVRVAQILGHGQHNAFHDN